MSAVIFSLLQFVCILLLKETFVQVQALQWRVQGSSLSHLSNMSDMICICKIQSNPQDNF